MYCYACGQSDYGIKPVYLEENKCKPLGELIVKETIIIEGQYCPKCRQKIKAYNGEEHSIEELLK